MRNRIAAFGMVMAVALTGALVQAQSGVGQGQGSRGGNLQLGFLPVQDVSQEEALGLQWMREEEKLARDVYLDLFTTWKEPVFANISASEQRHMDAVKALLDRYELADPVSDDTPGVFSEPQMAALYEDFVARGQLSLEDALTVGATIEDLDLADLAEQVAATDNTDIAVVYEHLARGSRNHLRAFVGELVALGGSYTPAYISIELFEEIMSTPMERGSQFARGRVGHGGGTGNGAGSGNNGGGNGNGGGSGNGGSNGNGGGTGTGGGNGGGSCDGTGSGRP